MCCTSTTLYTTQNKLRIFGYGFKFFGELYMSCTNDFVCDHSIVLWYEMYLFGVVSFSFFLGSGHDMIIIFVLAYRISLPAFNT